MATFGQQVSHTATVDEYQKLLVDGYSDAEARAMVWEEDLEQSPEDIVEQWAKELREFLSPP
jgi:hypothetical protein